MRKNGSTDSQTKRNRRVRAVYFRTDEELAQVKKAARKMRVKFTVFLREAALEKAAEAA